MQQGEEDLHQMPPNSTQNLNAKLSLTPVEAQRPGGTAPSFGPPPIHSSSPQNKIVSGPSHYRGGYHLSF